METANRPAWADALIASVLACVLTFAWAWRDWADLSALRLPDADDLMRLQQIRDWLGGQTFGDVAQHRLGAVGVPMHWSRLADLVPGGVIRALQGLVGRHQAELVAVIAWPAVLLAGAIALTGRIARAVGGDEAAPPAMIVAAIAYPASTLFLPGRIDHHGLQLVLLLTAVLMLMGKASTRAGVVAGVATTLSLVVGMEMTPVLVAAAGIAIGQWVIGDRDAGDRLMGFGVGLCAATLAASFVFRSVAWDYPACDAFTAISARAAMIASLVPIALAWFGRRLPARMRIGLALSSAVALGAILTVSTPQCLSPYGFVDPRLQRLWLAHVAEAQGLFEAPPGVAFGYAGLPVAGLIASAAFAWRTRHRDWVLLFFVQLTAAAVMLVQLRGAYAGAMLGAPALGAAIVAARRVGVLALAGAWAASAGIFYPLAAQATVRTDGAAAAASCTAPDLIASLGRLPPGAVMAPVDTGAPAIAATHQRLIAGAYHRNGAGNLAMYAFYSGTNEAARAIALRWHVRWVIACDGFAGVAAPFARQLGRGAAPDWLRPVATVPSGGRIFMVAEPPQSAA